MIGEFNVRKTKKRCQRDAGFQRADRLMGLMYRGYGCKPKRKFKAPTKRGVRPTILTFQHRMADIYQVPLFRMMGRTAEEEAARLREAVR